MRFLDNPPPPPWEVAVAPATDGGGMMPRALGGLALVVALAAYAAEPSPPAPPAQERAMTNPSAYFEIPVTDMDRAVAFYGALLGTDFERETVDGYEMALFPYDETGHGASGALARGDVYVPSLNGPIIYFSVADIDAALARARMLGAEILYDRKEVSPGTFVAEVRDSEGNRLALIERN